MYSGMGVAMYSLDHGWAKADLSGVASSTGWRAARARARAAVSTLSHRHPWPERPDCRGRHFRAPPDRRRAPGLATEDTSAGVLPPQLSVAEAVTRLMASDKQKRSVRPPTAGRSA